MKNTSMTSRNLQRTLAQIRHTVSKNAKIINAANTIITRIAGPSNRPITKRQLRDIKAKAKALSKTDLSLKLCQHREAIVRESTNLRSYHEALQLAKKHNPNDTVNPMRPLDRNQLERLCNHMQMTFGSIALCTLTAPDIDDDFKSLMRLV